MSRRSHLVFSARCSEKLGIDQRPDARCGKSWPLVVATTFQVIEQNVDDYTSANQGA